MANLSNHQVAALVSLLAGAKTRKALAGELDITEPSVQRMMAALRDRWLVRPLGKRGGVAQRPTNFTYELTAAGRLQVEAAQDNAAIAEPPAFVGSVAELERHLEDGGES